MFYRKQDGVQTQGDFSKASKTSSMLIELSVSNFRQITSDQVMTNKDLIGISSMMFVKGHNQKLYSMFNAKL